MRRLLIFIIVLAIGTGIGFFTYAAYNESKEELDYENLTSKLKTLYSSSTFEAMFSCDKEGRRICGYEYVTEENEDGETELFITVFVTAGDRNVLPTDEEGYVTVRIEGLKDIARVNYRTSEKDWPMDIFYE
jgi:hypothetical protein